MHAPAVVVVTAPLTRIGRGALLGGLLLIGAMGCATNAPTHGKLHAVDRLRAATVGGVRLPAPDTTVQAQAYLSGALSALRANQPRQASVFIDAILRSDHLTDRGRANVYWLAAEAHRMDGDDAELLDALGGFLVAAAVVEPDEELARREVEARATLLARKVKNNPVLGKTRSSAIPVEDARDPSGIVAGLGCGVGGDSPYIEDAVATHGDSSRKLEERRLICTDTGELLVLWFDLTHTSH